MNIQSSCDNLNFGTMIKEALARSPEACALRHGEDSWNRGELLTASQGLAERLLALDIAKGEPVLLELSASFDMVASLCAVVMIGGLAVPVDPELSSSRRQAIVSDVSPRLILRDGADGNGPRIETVAAAPRLAPHIAFLVYTSGTSGTPKGVEIGHCSYARRLTEIVSANPADPDDVDLLWTPAGFIGMLDEVFFPLFQGVPTVVATRQARRDPRAFAQLIARERVTAFRITPSFLDVILTDKSAGAFASVRKIYCSGEMLEDAVRQKVAALTKASLISFYGASEAPGVAYHLPIAKTTSSTGPLYTPQAFAQISIMSEDGSPQILGVPGEIWIGGLPVADGYWNRPKLTAEKFVLRDGKRWYRTGDLGLAGPDGKFEILGRLDQSEVNVMGVRVNLPDTSAALRTLPGIEAAWVSAVTLPRRADPMLVGHCVMAEGQSLDARALRVALSRSLPGAAIPVAFLAVDHLPLTANGKLDIQALAKAATDHLETRTQTVSTQSMNEDAGPPPEHLPVVLEAVEELLGSSGLSGNEDFFDLGGSSLQAVQLALTLSEKLNKQLPAEIVFSTQNLSMLARVCAEDEIAHQGPLRLLRAGDPDARPLFTVNSTTKYLRLTEALKAPGTVYNLNIFSLTNQLIDRLDDLTLNDLAERLTDALLAAYPTGPWRLMAYCQDGCLAVEIGRLLHARTGQSAELFLIDTFFLDHKPSLKMSVMRMVDLGPSYYVTKAVQKLRGREANDTQASGDEANPVQKSLALANKSKNDGRLYKKYVEFFTAYSPPHYSGKVNLFVSSEWKHVNLRRLHEMAGDMLIVHNVPGLHDTLFAPGHLSLLAGVIDGVLDMPVNQTS